MRLFRAVLLFLVAVVLPLGVAGAADWSKAKTFNVTMIDDAFKPADLTFKQGITYRLHLDNEGKETHEFTATDFFKAIEMRNPDVTGPDRIEIVVQSGQKKDLYFVAKQAGSYDLRCSDHDWAGMVGHITISP